METCPINSAHRVLTRNMPKHLILCKKAADNLRKKNWKPNAEDENVIAQVPRNWRPLSPSLTQRPWWENLIQQKFIGVPNYEPELELEIESEALPDGNVAENEDDTSPPLHIDPGIPVCKICQLRNIEMTFNCGHTTCEACYKKMADGSCPFCRRCIVQKIKLFF